MPRASGDLLKQKALELFRVRRQIRRLQIREEKLERSIGRTKDTVGFKKRYSYTKGKDIELEVLGGEVPVIEAKTLLKVVKRQPNFSVKRDFFDMLVVSVKKVRQRFGRKVAERLAYGGGKFVRIVVKEVEKKEV